VVLMDLTVENVCGLLIRSRLLAVDGVKAMYARWQAEAATAAGDVTQFTKWLVAQQYVTEYQAALIARGRVDNFFLNDYKILDRLGQGRMAGVYKAVHHLGQVVAIKVLPPSKAKEPNLLARFQREARMAMRLKHPNVVRTFQTGEAGGVQYLVMEYLEGETLDEILERRGKLAPAEAVRLVYQALQGLQHIHEQGLVHRDLKPSNLMLASSAGSRGADSTPQGTVKILDIGLGRALFDETISEPPKETDQLTAAGVLMGTPDYLAPEQARDAHTADIRADIYGLGCVLYHCLAGQPPFPDTNLVNQMIRHATETPRPLQEFNPAVPDGLQQIVNWMMAKEASQRYQTPDRAAQALQVFLAAGAAPLPPAEAEPKMRSYLTWLEMSKSSPEGSPPPAPSPEAAVSAVASDPNQAITDRPLKPAPVSTPEGRPKHSRSRHKHHAKKPKPHLAPPAAEPKVAEPAPNWDVELVPTLPLLETAVAIRSFVLTRRDLLMLGIGAGSVTAAGLIGMAVARLSGRKPRPSSADAGDSNKGTEKDSPAGEP
jgi:serine/threonine protein kinase